MNITHPSESIKNKSWLHQDWMTLGTLLNFSEPQLLQLQQESFPIYLQWVLSLRTGGGEVIGISWMAY